METSALRADRLTRAVTLSLIALTIVAAVLGFAQSYLRWLDPIIDAGRDLYIAERILEGTKLYRDIRYVYPPLTPYLMAGWVAAFGASLVSFATLGLAIAAAVAGSLYALVRRAASPAAAASAALLFVSLHVFGASTWGANYVFPYTYSATVGLLAYLLFGVCALGTLESRWAGLATGLFAVIAAWSKLEFTFAVAIACGAMLFVPRIRAKLAWIPALAAASLGLVSFVFRDSPDGHHWLFDNVLVSTLLSGASSSRFYAEVFGSDAPAARLREVAGGAAMIAAFAGLVALFQRRESRMLRLSIVAALVLITIALANDNFFKGWALLQLVLLPFAIRERARSPLLVLLALSLGTSIRVFLNLKPGWYGFVFAVPTYALIACVLFEYLPSRGAYSRRAAFAWLPLFVVLSASGLWQQRERYALKQFPIETARGTLIDSNRDRADILNQAIPFVRQIRPAGLVVIPEGLGINYLASIPTPLSFHVFTPPETSDRRVEEQILAEMKSKRPGMVAIDSRDVREFGSRGFGVDYCEELNRYIRANYVVERAWMRPGFSLLLLRQNDRAQPAH